MAKKKQVTPFEGRWHIVSMSTWAEDYFNMEVQAFIEFGKDQQGEFQFGLVQGGISYRLTERNGKPAVEWSWEGNDENDPVTGRGWAVLEGDDLHGMIFIHQGDQSDFVARKPG
jgi:hypothetical protein